MHQGTWKIGIKYRKVAIKTMKPESMKPEKFLLEANLMKDLNHPKILKLLAIVSIDDPLMIITEYLAKGDLKEYLKGEEGQLLGVLELCNISHQVIKCSKQALPDCITFWESDFPKRLEPLTSDRSHKQEVKHFCGPI